MLSVRILFLGAGASLGRGPRQGQCPGAGSRVGLAELCAPDRDSPQQSGDGCCDPHPPQAQRAACSCRGTGGRRCPKKPHHPTCSLSHCGDTGHLAFPGALLHDCFPEQSGPPPEHGQGARTPCSWPQPLCGAALHPCYARCEPGRSPCHGAGPHLLPALCTAGHTGSVTHSTLTPPSSP